MQNDSLAPGFVSEPATRHPRCREIGRLICTDVGYALHRSDGADLWLEMENIPQNLIEREVVIAGTLYGLDLISVESIGPALG